ncbi:MAG: hypothetical protein HN348_23670, partial [Proteobacteria bacterium]|nr:hypothetical protein [Pseudomonadota bacterium]
NRAGRRAYAVNYGGAANQFAGMTIYAEFSGNSILPNGTCNDDHDHYLTGQKQLYVTGAFDTGEITYRGNLTLGQIDHTAGDIIYDATPITSPNPVVPDCYSD